MSRSKPRKPKPILLNTLEFAVNRISLITRSEQLRLKLLYSQALEGLMRCQKPEANWRLLADFCNIAEALADLGICSDDASREIISNAETVLGDVRNRVSAALAGNGPRGVTVVEIRT